MVHWRHDYLMPMSFSFYCCRPLPHPIVFKTSASDSLIYILCTSVTIHLTLPDSRLQYFLHTSINMNHSQGIYVGIGVALVDCCYKFMQSHSPHLLKTYTNHETLEDRSRQMLLKCVFTAPVVSLPPFFIKTRSGMFLPLSR
jgi:hypothetical protein